MALFIRHEGGAQARQNLVGDPCETIPEEVCSRKPGTVVKDDTGLSASGGGIDHPIHAKHIDKLVDKAKGEASKILQSWRTSGIYEQRIQNAGLSRSPACSGANNFNSPSCVQLVSEILSAILSYDAMFDEPSQMYQRFPILSNIRANSWLSLAGLHRFSEDKQMKSISDRLAAEFAREVYDPKVEQRLRHHYDLVKTSFIEILQEKFADHPALKEMVARVKRTELQGTDCRNNESRSASRFLMANGFYNPSTQTIQICYSYAAQESLYKLSRLIGHELGHAVDPCRLLPTPKTPSRGPLEWLLDRPPNESAESAAMAELPTRNLIPCLYSDKSVKAHRIILFRLDFCRESQINEAVSDWMSIETLTHMIKKGEMGSKKPEDLAQGIANAYSDLCYSGSRDYPYHTHPATRARIERIALVHPDLRQMMGCKPLPSDRRYCSVDGGGIPPKDKSARDKDGVH